MLLQLGLETLEQREGIGRATGKAGQDSVVVEAADLAGIALHDGITQGDLAVTANDDVFVAPY